MWRWGRKVVSVAGVEDYSDEDTSGFTKFMAADLRWNQARAFHPKTSCWMCSFFFFLLLLLDRDKQRMPSKWQCSENQISISPPPPPFFYCVRFYAITSATWVKSWMQATWSRPAKLRRFSLPRSREKLWRCLFLTLRWLLTSCRRWWKNGVQAYRLFLNDSERDLEIQQDLPDDDKKSWTGNGKLPSFWNVCRKLHSFQKIPYSRV